MKQKEPLTNAQQLDILLSMAAIFGGTVISSLTDWPVYKAVLTVEIVLGAVWLILTILFRRFCRNGRSASVKGLAAVMRTVLILLLVTGGAYLLLGQELYQDKLTH